MFLGMIMCVWVWTISFLNMYNYMIDEAALLQAPRKGGDCSYVPSKSD